jgi:hypothetical protein
MSNAGLWNQWVAVLPSTDVKTIAYSIAGTYPVTEFNRQNQLSLAGEQKA